MSKSLIAISLLFIITGFVKCRSGHKSEGHSTLLDRIRTEHQDLTYAHADANSLDTSLLTRVSTDIRSGHFFYTESRSMKLISFPCSNCHNLPLDDMQTKRPSGQRRSHWNIHLAHAPEAIMNCTTCHARNDMDQLTSLTEQFIPLDQSFKQCAQCHSSQYNDWVGGAHGKQLQGWAFPRVAKTCVSCHDPHKPAFSPRFPARLNTHDLNK